MNRTRTVDVNIHAVSAPFIIRSPPFWSLLRVALVRTLLAGQFAAFFGSGKAPYGFFTPKIPGARRAWSPRSEGGHAAPGNYADLTRVGDNARKSRKKGLSEGLVSLLML